MKKVTIIFTLNGTTFAENTFAADEVKKQVTWMQGIKKRFLTIKKAGDVLSYKTELQNHQPPKTAPNTAASAQFTVDQLQAEKTQLKRCIDHARKNGRNPESYLVTLQAVENHISRLQEKYLGKKSRPAKDPAPAPAVVVTATAPVPPAPPATTSTASTAGAATVTFEGSRYIFHPDIQIFANLDHDGKFITLDDVRTLYENELLTIDATELLTLKKYVYATATT